MPLTVNLDAFIQREDFEATADKDEGSLDINSFRMVDLGADGIGRAILRKPDFQRETNAWTGRKIVDLIQSFLDRELIPSVILWKSPATGKVFVIDGAHRLSALMAWSLNDYGDGDLSRRFFSNRIPDEQQVAADQVRRMIEREIGTYAAVKNAIFNPELSKDEHVRWGREFATTGISLQWVRGGVDKAEKSFKAINDKATPIDKTESKLIAERRKPTALATRAIISSGTGHPYWGHFPEDVRAELESTAREVYKLLFTPEQSSTVQPELPVGGKAYSGEGVRLVYDLVDYASRSRRSGGPTRILFGSKATSLKPLEDDLTGHETLEYLSIVRKTLEGITGKAAASLGLHPAVYYYSATAARQPTAIFATIRLVEELRSSDALHRFTEHRAAFEDYLVANKDFINQIIKKYGSEDRGLPALSDLFQVVFECINMGQNDDETFAVAIGRPSLKFLVRNPPPDDGTPGGGFSRSAKSVAEMRAVLDSALRCSVCGARLQLNSSTVDHVQRREDGGTNAADNAALAHPFCNTGYKERLHHRATIGKPQV